MNNIVIYHNPRCRKSRETLNLIKSNNIEPTIILYLKEKLLKKDIFSILKKLDLHPRKLLRNSEIEYKNNNLSDPNLTKDQIVDFMIKYPILIERPIVIKGDKAVIARPPENVLQLIKILPIKTA